MIHDILANTAYLSSLKKFYFCLVIGQVRISLLSSILCIRQTFSILQIHQNFPKNYIFLSVEIRKRGAQEARDGMARRHKK